MLARVCGSIARVQGILQIVFLAPCVAFHGSELWNQGHLPPFPLLLSPPLPPLLSPTLPISPLLPFPSPCLLSPLLPPHLSSPLISCPLLSLSLFLLFLTLSFPPPPPLSYLPCSFLRAWPKPLPLSTHFFPVTLTQSRLFSCLLSYLTRFSCSLLWQEFARLSPIPGWPLTQLQSLGSNSQD